MSPSNVNHDDRNLRGLIHPLNNLIQVIYADPIPSLSSPIASSTSPKPNTRPHLPGSRKRNRLPDDSETETEETDHSVTYTSLPTSGTTKFILQSSVDPEEKNWTVRLFGLLEERSRKTESENEGGKVFKKKKRKMNGGREDQDPEEEEEEEEKRTALIGMWKGFMKSKDVESGMGIHKVSRAISAGEVHVQLRPRAQISNPDNGLSRKGRTSGEVENRAEIRAEDAGNRRTKELTKNWRSSEENSHRHEDGEDSMTQDEGDEESTGAAPSAEDDDGEDQEPAERIKHCDLIAVINHNSTRPLILDLKLCARNGQGERQMIDVCADLVTQLNRSRREEKNRDTSTIRPNDNAATGSRNKGNSRLPTQSEVSNLSQSGNHTSRNSTPSSPHGGTEADGATRTQTDEIKSLKARITSLEHQLRDFRRAASATAGGYKLDPTEIVGIRIPKGASRLQVNVKKPHKVETGFADDDDEW